MMITREDVDDFFDDLEERGEDPKQLRWEFYFYDHQRPPLARMEAELVSRGYCNVEVWDPDPSNDDKELMFLHFDMEVAASRETIWKRCQELDAMARQFGVEGFDGFDASRVGGDVMPRRGGS